jgi:hypothetical protein
MSVWGFSLLDTWRGVSAIRATTRVNTYHVMAAVTYRNCVGT